jgi:putative glycosyltransferase (TIGR04372 family)
MTTQKKNNSFIFRQMRQIKADGLHIVWRKIMRLGALALMNMFAPLAVALKVDWPQAQLFMFRQAQKRLKKKRIEFSQDRDVVNKLHNNVIQYFRLYTSRRPKLMDWSLWTEVYRLAAGLFLVKGDIKNYNDSCRRVADVRQELAREHQLNKLSIQFLPRALPSGSIGVFEFLEAYVKAAQLGWNPSKELVLLLDPRAPVTNPRYLKHWERYITVISDPALIQILSDLEKCLTVPLAFFMPVQEKVMISRMALGLVREKWLRDGRAPLLTLSKSEYERGWENLASVGVPQNAWFVCLHVREPGWGDFHTPEENFRNADINTYRDAVEAITAAGGWVIRMGDAGNSRLPEILHVIDYAHSAVKSDDMDIFLCSQCRFFIGTSSGLYTVAMAFGTPVVLTNLLPVCALYYLSSQDLFIPRACRFQDRDRYVKFSELLAPPIGLIEGQSNFDVRNIQVVNNAPEDITGVVEEMLRRCNGGGEYSADDQLRQDRFQAVAAQCGKLYGDDRIMGQVSIGRNFLRKYEALLDTYGVENISQHREDTVIEPAARAAIY